MRVLLSVCTSSVLDVEDPESSLPLHFSSFIDESKLANFLDIVFLLQLMYSLDNFQDKGRSDRSLYLFGYGDGGQGPT